MSGLSAFPRDRNSYPRRPGARCTRAASARGVQTRPSHSATPPTPTGGPQRVAAAEGLHLFISISAIYDYMKSPILSGLSGAGGNAATSFRNIVNNAGTSFVIVSHKMPKSMPE